MNVRFSNEHLIVLQITGKEVVVLDANAWEDGGTTGIPGDDEKTELLDPDCGLEDSTPTADAANDVVSDVLISLNDFSSPKIICDVEFTVKCEASIWNKHFQESVNIDYSKLHWKKA